jgi:hypothetical protein
VKKSSLLFMASTIISLSLLGMEKEISKEKKIGLYLVPKQLCTVPEQALFLVALNATQTPDYYNYKKTPDIIKKISDVSQNLKTVFNDPAIARDIITHSALSGNCFDFDIVEKFNFFGARCCLAATEALCNKQPDPSNIEWLFNNNGAILNYRLSCCITPLSYWTKSNDPDSVPIIEKLIALGADPTCDPHYSDNCFGIAIEQGNKNKLDALLTYYTTMHGESIIPQSIWSRILILYYHDLGHGKKCPALIERLIENVSRNSCSVGLKAAIDVKEPLYETQRSLLLQKFIECNADAGAALKHLFEYIELRGPDYLNSEFISDFDTLVNAGAYNAEIITRLQKILISVNFMIFKIECNKK